MISTFETRYCCENPLLIEGRDEAMKDRNECWKLVHRNIFTQVGIIEPGALRRMGMFWNRPANELIYMKRAIFRQCVALHRNRCIKLAGGTKGKVFSIFRMIHPDKLFFTLTPEDFFNMEAKIARLHDVLKVMVYNCHNPDSSAFKFYGGRGVRVCDEWRNDSDKFVAYIIKQGYELGMEIQRKDKQGDFEPNNIMITRGRKQ